jgi:hypothetical protein
MLQRVLCSHVLVLRQPHHQPALAPVPSSLTSGTCQCAKILGYLRSVLPPIGLSPGTELNLASRIFGSGAKTGH